MLWKSESLWPNTASDSFTVGRTKYHRVRSPCESRRPTSFSFSSPKRRINLKAKETKYDHMTEKAIW